MKNILAVLAALVAGLAGSGAALAEPDLATGAGWFSFTPHVAFSAHSGPLGEDPDGVFQFSSGAGGTSFVGDVTCLHVVGNTAMIGGIIRGGFGVAEGEGFLVPVQDNGEPMGGSAPDRIGPQTILPLGVPFFCPPPIEPVFPLEQGNIVVMDRLPGG